MPCCPVCPASPVSPSNRLVGLFRGCLAGGARQGGQGKSLRAGIAEPIDKAGRCADKKMCNSGAVRLAVSLSIVGVFLSRFFV